VLFPLQLGMIRVAEHCRACFGCVEPVLRDALAGAGCATTNSDTLNSSDGKELISLTELLVGSLAIATEAERMPTVEASRPASDVTSEVR
jgi:hypothetical protein